MKHKLISASLMLATLFILAACGAQSYNSSAPSSTATSPSVQIITSAPATATPANSSSPASTLAPTQPSATEAPTQAATAMPTTAPMPTALAQAAVPACTSPAALTPSETEGPYYKAGSPERASLLDPGISGTQLVLTGYVLTADCKPVAHAWLDFWQANAQGQYDNSGYTLRGHLYTDASGRYQLTTIVPGLYPGRTEHVHVKVQAPNGPVLTTQLYFPNVSNNQQDGIFDPKMVINIQNTGSSLTGTFNFVVSTP